MIVNGFLAQQNAILSGYIGNLEIAKVIANTVVELKKLNSNSLCCCDPVFGDKYDEDENGHIFASADHPNIFLSHLLPLSDIITPNLFELSILSDFQIGNYNDIITACKKLISKTGNHNQVIIITSVSFSNDKTGIAIYQHDNFSYLESPKYKVQSKVSGSSDITAAVFLSYLLKGKDLEETLKAVTQCLDGLFRITKELNTDELALIQAQEYIK